jgi:DNA-binding GntR family transcriptional regulator
MMSDMTTTAAAPIQHQTMADAVASRLRRMIISRELEPGQRITQAELATRLGVSTMPIREALLRLIADGMVIGESNRSFAIAGTTPADIRDIYWMHATLSGELTARAFDNQTEELITEMDRHHREYKRAAKAGNWAALSDANWQFHAAVNRAAASPTIVRALRNTLHYFPDFSFEVAGWTDLAERWQAGVLSDFRNGTREGARDVATTSIQKAADLFILSFWTDKPESASRPARSSGRQSRRPRSDQPSSAAARKKLPAPARCALLSKRLHPLNGIRRLVGDRAVRPGQPAGIFDRQVAPGSYQVLDRLHGRRGTRDDIRGDPRRGRL